MAIGPHNPLRGQIDRQAIAGRMLGEAEQGIHLNLGQNDGQQAVLETVVVENVGEGFGEDGAKAKILQRPWRMLAR